MKIKAIDLNCDMGESYGPYKLGQDEELIQLISSANIGCGFHGGDPHVMRATVAIDGTALEMNCQSLCVHGDTPGAVDFVKQVRSVLVENNVQIKPMREIIGS